MIKSIGCMPMGAAHQHGDKTALLTSTGKVMRRELNTLVK